MTFNDFARIFFYFKLWELYQVNCPNRFIFTTATCFHRRYLAVARRWIFSDAVVTFQSHLISLEALIGGEPFGGITHRPLTDRQWRTEWALFSTDDRVEVVWSEHFLGTISAKGLQRLTNTLFNQSPTNWMLRRAPRSGLFVELFFTGGNPFEPISFGPFERFERETMGE